LRFAVSVPGSNCSEDGGESADAQRIVAGNRDVVLALDLGGQA
jgi:hypothetical protein